MLPIGSLVNAAAVLAGSLLGLVLHDRMSSRVKAIVFQGLGLCILAIGMGMGLKMQNPVTVVLSVVSGGIAGELLRLEERFTGLAAWLKRAIKSRNETFSNGFITASLLYCLGSLAILGSLDQGLRGDHTLLFTKAVIDGFAAIALAASYGLGVTFSAIPLFLYQMAITYSAQLVQPFFTDPLLAQLTGCGGVLILGIGVNLLEIKRIPLSNLLPALPIIVFITALLQ